MRQRIASALDDPRGEHHVFAFEKCMTNKIWVARKHPRALVPSKNRKKRRRRKDGQLEGRCGKLNRIRGPYKKFLVYCYYQCTTR